MQVASLKELQQAIRKENNISYTKKHLTDAIVEKYKDVRTSLNGSLAQCVNTSKRNLLYSCIQYCTIYFFKLYFIWN